MAVLQIRNISFNKKVFIRIVIFAVIAAIIASSGVWLWSKSKPASSTALQLSTAKVKRGDINVVITGTGSMVSSNKSDIIPKVAGTVTKVYYKEGDNVKAGDLLFEIDDSSVKNDINKINSNINQISLTQQSTTNSINKLNVLAPFNGTVTGVTLKTGDTVNKGATLFTISDQSKIKVTVPFSSSVIQNISIGSKAQVYLQNQMQSIEGIVTFKGSYDSGTNSGVSNIGVEILIDNPGGIKEGTKASAEISTTNGTFMSSDYGTVSFASTQQVKSDAGGTVGVINVKEGQQVAQGDLLITLSNDDLLVTKESNNTKLIDYRNQLENANKELANCKVYAPINGVIVSLSVKEGDAIKVAQSTGAIYDMTQMECTVPVDELDIAKVKAGQTAKIIVDALTQTQQKPLTGTISKVAILGTSTNGVTTYPVTISIPNTEGIKQGMNISAEIFLENKQNVLYVPIEAVQKVGGKAFVMVQKTGNETGASGMPTDGVKSMDRQAAKDEAQKDIQNSQNNSNKKSNASTKQNNKSSGTQAGSSQGTTASGKASAQSSSAGQTQNKAAVNTKYAEYYANTVMKPVEIGVNNESYIEIVSGLAEGDEVVLPPKVTTQSSGGIGSMMGGNPFGGAMGGNTQRATAPQTQGAPSTSSSGGKK